GDAQRSQSETAGGDTRDASLIATASQCAIFYLAGLRTGFVPEEFEARALDFVEQLLVGAFVRRRGRRLECFLSKAARRQRQPNRGCTGEAHEFSTGQQTPLLLLLRLQLRR